MASILYIDGRNLIGKLAEVFSDAKRPEPEWHKYDFDGLFSLVLTDVPVDERRIYFAKLREHSETREKSKELIASRRLLKTHLDNTGFVFVRAGNVRAREKKDIHGNMQLVFGEKGVDTRIVADIVENACDGILDRAIIASSDSDLQPAMSVLKRRSVSSTYLGFEINPNKGMSYTAKHTILIRNAEVIKYGQNLGI